jgi:hypothetical protein
MDENCPTLSNSIENTGQTIRPEWLSIAQSCEYLHMGKTSLYSYLDINGGAIRTVNTRKRGCIKGKRLVSYDSLRTFVNGFDST